MIAVAVGARRVDDAVAALTDELGPTTVTGIVTVYVLPLLVSTVKVTALVVPIKDEGASNTTWLPVPIVA